MAAAVAKDRQGTDLADRVGLKQEAPPELVAGRVGVVARLAERAFHLLLWQRQFLGAILLDMAKLLAFCAPSTRRTAE
jgi:hypothetical protein